MITRYFKEWSSNIQSSGSPLRAPLPLTLSGGIFSYHTRGQLWDLVCRGQGCCQTQMSCNVQDFCAPPTKNYPAQMPIVPNIYKGFGMWPSGMLRVYLKNIFLNYTISYQSYFMAGSSLSQSQCQISGILTVSLVEMISIQTSLDRMAIDKSKILTYNYTKYKSEMIHIVRQS